MKTNVTIIEEVFCDVHVKNKSFQIKIAFSCIFLDRWGFDNRSKSSVGSSICIQGRKSSTEQDFLLSDQSEKTDKKDLLWDLIRKNRMTVADQTQ